jgi:AmmeMemoRadiSam system protein B
MRIRPPAVAGAFYPADPTALMAAVERCLAAGRATLAAAGEEPPTPRALIAPHAGYVYSGPIAGTAYALVQARRPAIEQVILLGPAHQVAMHGLAASTADAFATPLGTVPIDGAGRDALLGCDGVQPFDRAHEAEHCLEVHLPFLQRILGRFSLVPVVVGDAAGEQVAAVVERLWGGHETLVVVSSDLSHYHDYATAQRLDRATCDAIAALAPERLGGGSACGRVPIAGLLAVARRRGLRAHLLDRRNSGDTAGARDEVVGYASFAFA